ncbi:hypothetical protein [Actinacidiphila sp. ITFR-21]|uniref:hypothetical protein n=1 Tax=Actinacidiphila sp. ITFR-21 TaxID=3075199 RepID=UPI00288B0E28|nr:hypothetical protein [Streptomyces sp. ITFR-21]WNI19937.1 hypothetical protein RLT57_30820 [Streptomyces sp. ITFR-21]
MDYQLTIHTAGETTVRHITAEPDKLAQAVHRHVRGLLGGNGLAIRLDGMEGTAHRGTAHVADLALAEAALEEERTAQPTAGPDEIRYGYTLRDIDRMARAACAADRTLSSDITTRYDTAWSAIAETLCAAPEPPTRHDLTRAGWQAIYHDVKAVRRLYGVDSTDRSGEVASAPRFVAYWTRGATHAADEGVTERIAVHEILATLPEHLREAVVALAALDDYQKAADSLGIKYTAMTVRMSNARRRFRAHWYAPETAPAIKGTDRRIGSRAQGVPTHCPQGHEYTPENTIRRPGRPRSRICRTCDVARDAARRARKTATA